MPSEPPSLAHSCLKAPAKRRGLCCGCGARLRGFCVCSRAILVLHACGAVLVVLRG